MQASIQATPVILPPKGRKCSFVKVQVGSAVYVMRREAADAFIKNFAANEAAKVKFADLAAALLSAGWNEGETAIVADRLKQNGYGTAFYKNSKKFWLNEETAAGIDNPADILERANAMSTSWRITMIDGHV